jgi:hypothetical protein
MLDIDKKENGLLMYIEFTQISVHALYLYITREA